jgi:hypothetical protein
VEKILAYERDHEGEGTESKGSVLRPSAPSGQPPAQTA